MHFCTECGNMYYIRLTDTNGIVYYCRNCGHEDDTITIDDVVVSHTTMRSGNDQYAHVVNKYTKLDPTLPRISTILCPNMECPCNRNHNATQYADRAAIVGTTDEEAASLAGAAASISAKIACFSAIFSGAASKTKAAFCTAAATPATTVMRGKICAISPSATPISRKLSVTRAIKAARASATGSVTRTA